MLIVLLLTTALTWCFAVTTATPVIEIATVGPAHFSNGLCTSTFSYVTRNYLGEVTYVPTLEGAAPFELANPENVVLFDELVRRPESFDAARTEIPTDFHERGEFTLRWKCCDYEKATWRLLTWQTTSFSTCTSLPVEEAPIETLANPNTVGPYRNISVTFLEGNSALVWYPTTNRDVTKPCRLAFRNLLEGTLEDETIVSLHHEEETHDSDVTCTLDAAIVSSQTSFPAIVIVGNETAIAFRSIASHLATRGFIVAVLNHPESYETSRDVALNVALVVTQLRGHFGTKLDESRLGYVGHDIGADAAESVVDLLGVFEYVAILAPRERAVSATLSRVNYKMYAAGLRDDIIIGGRFEDILGEAYEKNEQNRRLYALGNFYGRMTFTDHCATDLLALYARLRHGSNLATTLYDEMRQIDCTLSPVGFSPHMGTAISIITTTIEEALLCDASATELANALQLTLGDKIIVEQRVDVSDQRCETNR